MKEKLSEKKDTGETTEQKLFNSSGQEEKVNVIVDKIASSKDCDSDAGSHADPIRKHIKYGTPLQVVKAIFLEYFIDSSIHGFKYIGDQKRHTLDRIIWLCALLLSIITCGYLISNIWNKRSSSPVIITFNEKPTPVWEIPFPAVTICPETKTHTDIFNYTDVHWKTKDHRNVTEKEKYYYDAISQICQPISGDCGNNISNESDLIGAMLSAAPKLNETVDECYWKYNITACELLFDTVLTKEGICFNYNSLKAKYYRDEMRDVFDYGTNGSIDWDLEHGYRMEADENSFPARVLGAGVEQSVILFLTARKQDEDQMCRSSIQGFKVVLHVPGDEPEVVKSFLNIPFDQTVFVAVTADIVTTSEGLRYYEPERRQCYFQGERYLRYFNVYTQANCELECLTNQTLQKCGCVRFSMPRNSTHPVCGARSINCADKVESDRLVGQFRQREQNGNKFDGDGDVSCNCLPTCMSIRYKGEIEHQVALDSVQFLQAYKEDEFLRDFPGTRMSQVYIYFKQDAFSALKRSELYSTTDFIANCGGLLGLFMGVSILSLVELVYFFTLRLWNNLKTRRMKHREMKKHKENE